ncbi:putative protein arginine N-methyltransferase 6 [Bulinus truncatus]|nr:putative protein arginine N-methyltransferase 6 [Bulinus truncatus]
MADSPPTDNYYNSYADLSVHTLMIKDRPRTIAYRNFFETYRDYVKDKVVLDVGAGTGILSLFAATAGAKKVYAVEASSVASLCQEIVEENHLEKVIQVIHGAVENISLPEKVDIIVSEWMGFYLLHESMLDSVILARDKFLSPDGIMVPSHATLYVAPVDMSDHFQDRADEWSNIYGFDFSPLASQLNMEDVSRPLIKCISPDLLRADPKAVFTLDLQKVKTDDVSNIEALLQFSIKKDAKIFGIAAWFNVHFILNPDSDFSRFKIDTGAAGTNVEKCINENSEVSGECSENNVLKKECASSDFLSSKPISDLPQGGHDGFSSLKTGPCDPPTHWKQTVILLPQAILVESGTEMLCQMKMVQSSENKRHYDITLCLVGDASDGDECGEDSCDAVDPDFEESSDHPIPCQCGSDRCSLIATLMKKMDDEEKDMQEEVDDIDQEVQDETAQQLNAEISKDNWQFDSSKSSQSLDEDSS